MRSLPFAIVLALTWAVVRAQEAMPVETVTEVKEATTYIRATVADDEDGPSVSGSGFVVGTDGTTGYIMAERRSRIDPSGCSDCGVGSRGKPDRGAGSRPASRAVDFLNPRGIGE